MYMLLCYGPALVLGCSAMKFARGMGLVTLKPAEVFSSWMFTVHWPFVDLPGTGRPMAGLVLFDATLMRMS